MPIIHYSDNSTQLYSHDLTDPAPFLAIRQKEGEVIFQILGGKTLELPLYLALEFSIDIQSAVFAALKYDQCDHEWATRYITIEDVDCPSGMYCTKCKRVLHQDEVEDLLNR